MNKFIHSVLKNKCPNCLKGSFFIVNNPYNLRDFEKMNNTCPDCGMDFRQEPGFYLGAAIVSYALQAGFFLLAYFLCQALIEVSFVYFVCAFALALIVLVPVTFRISRLLWVNMLGTRPK